MLIKITNGSFAFGVNIILSKINFEINKGEKLALIGRNGSGKTTLLKILTGEYELTKLGNDDEASIVRAENLSIGSLRQITFDDDSISLEEEVKKAYGKLLGMEARMSEILVELDRRPGKTAVREFSDLQESYALLGGYTYKKEYETAISRFGFSAEEKIRPLSQFSGGQRTKIAFIRLLLSKPELLLLDEPTNHLDINAIEWLEEYLKGYKNAVVLVSHDREFIDKVVTGVYEIERGKLHRYAGSYSAFAAEKRQSWERQQKEYISQQKEIARLSGLVERFRYKANKAAFAQSKIKQIERMDLVEAPEKADVKSFHGSFEPEYQSYKQVLTAKNLAIGYDKPLSEVSVEITRGQKIGIIGGNGLGKSTFLKTIVGMLPPLGGSFIIGSRVKLGFFDQQMAQYKSEKTVLDEYWDEFPELKHEEVRSALGAFLFSREEVLKTVSSLSGGEKVRLALCKIIRHRQNFLVLDEPTNHMDILGKETLEKMLKNYSGTLLFVSHDRYFIKQLATSLLVFEENRVDYYQYGYEQYIEQRAGKAAVTETVFEKEGRERRPYYNPGKEKTRREARLKKLELLLAECEEKIQKLNEELEREDIVSDYIRLTRLHEEITSQEAQNEEYLREWNTLIEEAENEDGSDR